ncbi:MAG: deoxyribonuclease IV [Actinobacteria bacterium]|nr:MAG: deoxyribonuclease IV [Actinomycetota bacterium]
MIIGSHVSPQDPLAEAAARGAEVVQIFMSNPQQWKPPMAREDAEELRTSPIEFYVHAPYLLNLASPNNRVRIPSRKALAQAVAAATTIGARGVVVHGGSVGPDEDESVGFERWRKALDSFDVTVPVLVENTAGRGNSIMHDLENYGPLWEEVGDRNVGVCLDTCHAWASGADLGSAVDLISKITGGVALVHANDSKDEAGSHRDRHANFGEGLIPEELLVGVVKAANTDVIVETPGLVEGQKADVAWLRERL